MITTKGLYVNVFMRILSTMKRLGHNKMNKRKNEIKVCIVPEKGSCVTMISGLLCCMAPSQHGQ